ncbi:MAG TPA: putative lipid II flippase FtsW [Terriglobales bacterium]|nr:putative lipid II flippase FtsW [Terriglobales bacterium]
MAKRVSVDKTLFTVTLLLVFVGLIMVFSASAVMAKERFGSPYAFVGKQFAWAVAGVLAMFLLMKVDYRHYRRPAIVFSLIGLTTLLLISVFFLDRSHNTHRWFRLGVLSFQPSELAKPAIIIYLAYFLETRVKQMEDWKHTLVPAVAPSVLMAGLIALQPDLGTAVAIAAITLSVLFVAGMNLKYFLYPLAAAPVVFYFLVWRVPWRHQRILAFMDPFADPLGKGFHIIQSLISVSTGGLTGMGLMEGKQKLFFLPEPHTDFIFAVIGEEFGLLGTLFVVSLFATFLFRGVRAAVVTRDTFGRYLATGIVAMICIQAFFNISVVLSLLPTKGIPLPFISYGGSSLFVMLASVGVLLNITQQAE